MGGLQKFAKISAGIIFMQAVKLLVTDLIELHNFSSNFTLNTTNLLSFHYTEWFSFYEIYINKIENRLSFFLRF